MIKIFADLFMKLILSHFIKSNKSDTLRTIVVIVAILCALGLLQYSDAMLNIHKAKSINDIEKPTLILEQKLESCNMLLDKYKEDLEFCRAGTCVQEHR